MMLRKACPRCGGDLFLERDDGPALLSCLQCGRAFAPASVQTASREPVALVSAAKGRAA